jgi:hypothetical protein
MKALIVSLLLSALTACAAEKGHNSSTSDEPRCWLPEGCDVADDQTLPPSTASSCGSYAGVGEVSQKMVFTLGNPLGGDYKGLILVSNDCRFVPASQPPIFTLAPEFGPNGLGVAGLYFSLNMTGSLKLDQSAGVSRGRGRLTNVTSPFAGLGAPFVEGCTFDVDVSFSEDFKLSFTRPKFDQQCQKVGGQETETYDILFDRIIGID